MANIQSVTKRLQKNGSDTAYQMTFEIKEKELTTSDIELNQSRVDYTIKVKKLSGSGYWTNDNDGYAKVTFDNAGSPYDSQYNKFDFRNTTEKVMLSGTYTAPHGEDGKKTLHCHGYFKDNGGNLGSRPAEFDIELTDVPRASTPTYSSSSVILGNSVRITTNRASNSFTHTITININGHDVVIGNNIGEYKDWTPDISYADYITDSENYNCSVTCTTKNNGNPVGNPTTTYLKLVVPSSAKPSVSINSIAEKNATMISKNWKDSNNNPVYVQNKSQLAVGITTTKSYGSDITSTIVKVNNVNATYDSGTSKYISSTLTSSGTNSISVSATDKRNHTGTASSSVNVIAYSPPSISNVELRRCDSNGTLNDNGTSLKYTFTGVISPIKDSTNVNHNTASWKIYYKKTTDGSYTDGGTLSTALSYSPSGVVHLIGLLNTDYAYNIKIVGTDAFGAMANPYVETLDTGFDLMNFNSSGKAMAIGKVSSAGANESKLEIALPTTISENVTMTSGKTITGNLTGSVNGNANTATTLATFSYSRNNATNTWCKVATTQLASTWGEKHAILFIKGTHNSNYNQNGIVAIDAVGGGTAGAVSSYAARFFSCTPDLDASNFYIEYKNGNADTPATINFWLKMASAYAGWHVKLLQNVGWTVAQSTPTTTTMPSSGFTGKNSERHGFAARSYGDKNGSDITTTYQKKPVQLYNNTSGTTGTIALSETSANFEYIEFFYKTNDGNYASTKVYGPNGKTVSLTATHDNGTYVYIKTALVLISGTSVTFSRNTQTRIGNNVATTHSADANISIVRIIGYK